MFINKKQDKKKLIKIYRIRGYYCIFCQKKNHFKKSMLIFFKYSITIMMSAIINFDSKPNKTCI